MSWNLKFILLMVVVVSLVSCGDSGEKKGQDNNVEVKERQQEEVNAETNTEDKKTESIETVELEIKEQKINEQVVKQERSKYSAEIVPANMTVKEKKARFKSLLLPAVKSVYNELEIQFKQVSELLLINDQDQRILDLKKNYRATTNEELLMAIKPHPISIALAQAAMESAWGTSRFFREAKNIFGVWSFDKNEPRIAASQKRGNKTVWVKKYPSIKAAIKDYYRVLARGNAFKDFRKQKMYNSNPYELVKKLEQYSEKGDEYGKELASMIKYNKFYQYDINQSNIN